MTEQPLSELEELRSKIDIMDAQIIKILGRRFDLCRRIARLKKDQCIPMMQPGRVEAVKRRCIELGIQTGLDPTLVNDLYGLIIRQSCLVETDIIEGGSG